MLRLVNLSKKPDAPMIPTDRVDSMNEKTEIRFQASVEVCCRLTPKQNPTVLKAHNEDSRFDEHVAKARDQATKKPKKLKFECMHPPF